MSIFDPKECRPPDRGAQQLVDLCEAEAITCSEGDHHSKAVDPAYAQYGAIIGEVLTVQGARMDAAAAEERKRKAAAAESRKRATSASAEHPPEAKRAKLEPEETPLAATPSSSSTTPSPLASFDFTTLPASLITDLIVANLDAFTEVALVDLIQNYRTSNNIGPNQKLQNELAAVSTPPPVVVKEEPIDPMQMDIDQDEIEYEPEQLNLEKIHSNDGFILVIWRCTAGRGSDAGADVSPETLDLQLVEFKLPPPKDLDEEERITLLRVGVSRIWTGADEARQGADVTHADPAQDMWILLIIRMITRAAEQPTMACS
ncbi:Symplekin tight junction protein terminal-domain-containing [Salix suchowensis]|nr:Symplekin tight junction protein terminal-domain-containing [Salix suchowensis]